MFLKPISIFSMLFLNTVLCYSDCGSKNGVLLSTQITGCNEQDPECILKKGTQVTIELKFTNVNSEKVIAKVSGTPVILNTTVEFPIGDPCKSITCPVKSSETYTYKASIPVLKFFPRIAVDVKWQLLDDKNEPFICLDIPAKIK